MFWKRQGNNSKRRNKVKPRNQNIRNGKIIERNSKGRMFTYLLSIYVLLEDLVIIFFAYF